MAAQDGAGAHPQIWSAALTAMQGQLDAGLPAQVRYTAALAQAESTVGQAVSEQRARLATYRRFLHNNARAAGQSSFLDDGGGGPPPSGGPSLPQPALAAAAAAVAPPAAPAAPAAPATYGYGDWLMAISKPIVQNIRN